MPVNGMPGFITLVVETERERGGGGVMVAGSEYCKILASFLMESLVGRRSKFTRTVTHQGILSIVQKTPIKH